MQAEIPRGVKLGRDSPCLQLQLDWASGTQMALTNDFVLSLHLGGGGHTPDQCSHSSLPGAGGILRACRILILILGLHPLDASDPQWARQECLHGVRHTPWRAHWSPRRALFQRMHFHGWQLGQLRPVGASSVSLAASVLTLPGTR